MKTVINYLFIACMTLTLTACGGIGNDKTKTETDNNLGYSTYKEALAAEDFEAVHRILSQAEAEITKCNSSGDREDFADKFGFGASEYDLNKIKLEVLKSELTFLVSQNKEELNNRIIFLINENSELLKKKDKFDEYCNHVATLAANQGNEDLIKKIAEQFQDPSLLFENPAVARLGKGKDFFIEMRYDYLKQGIDIPRPQLGMVKSNHYGDLEEEYEEYIKKTSTYNRLCIAAMKDALDADNVDLAKKVSKLIKKNIKYEDLGDWCQVVEKNEYTSVYEAFKVTEDDSDIKEAQSLINNAK